MRKIFSILIILMLFVNIWAFSDNAYLEKAWGANEEIIEDLPSDFTKVYSIHTDRVGSRISEIVKNTTTGKIYLKIRVNFKNGWLSRSDWYGTSLGLSDGTKIPIDHSVGGYGWTYRVYYVELNSTHAGKNITTFWRFQTSNNHWYTEWDSRVYQGSTTDAGAAIEVNNSVLIKSEWFNQKPVVTINQPLDNSWVN